MSEPESDRPMSSAELSHPHMNRRLRYLWPVALVAGVVFLVVGAVKGSGVGINGWYEPGGIMLVVGLIGATRSLRERG
jgi:hypothetical protein